MASGEEGENSKASNLFSNDGSFMEQFMKMQQEKTSEAKTEPATSSNTHVSMKLAPVKKQTPTSFIQKRIKSRAAKKAFAADSDSEGETENTKESEPSATPSSTMADIATPSSTVADIKSTASPSTTTTTNVTLDTSKGRKRKSKWDVGGTADSRVIHEAIGSFTTAPSSSAHSSVLPQQQLTPAQQEQLREQIAMQKMVAEIKSATQQAGVGSKRNRYEYDSDEEVEGGTWEHKTRTKEMKQTEEKADELTEKGKGKHHIGDFLPPEELDKFVETVQAVKEDRTPDFSDYKEHKLTEDNIGFKMLQKSGWDEGTGLGAQQQGITAPVNKGKQSFDQSGLGAVKPAEVKKADDEFDLYRKRMMLAYRFRPNPLNNPRRPYY